MIDEQDDSPTESTPYTLPEFPFEIPTARPIADMSGIIARPIDAMMLAPISKGAAWADMGLVVLILIASEFLVGFIATFGFAVDFNNEAELADFGRRMLIPTIAIRTAVVLFAVPWLTRRRHLPAIANGLTWRNFPLNAVLGIGATLVAYVMIYASLFACAMAWPEAIEQMQENAGRIMSLIPKQHPLVFALISLMIGLYEEVLFRGFLMTRLRRVSGSWVVGVLITTAIFTALHAPDQTPMALVFVAILGLVFSLVTIWRRSLVPAIVGHMLFDLSQFIALYLQAGDSWQ